MFFPLQFSTLKTSHHTQFLYVSIPQLPAALPLFCRNKTKYLLFCCVYRGGQSHCAAEQQWCCTTSKFHTYGCMTPVTESQHIPSPYYQQLCRTPIHWYSHSNPNPTTESWTANFPSPCTSDSYHCTQLFPHPVPQTHITLHNISLNLYLRHTSLYTFPSPCTSDTHHCTQHFPQPVPQTHITVHNISLNLYLRHTSLYTTFPSPCISDTHHCTQHFPHPVPHTHITVRNISLTLYLTHTSLYATFPSPCTSDTHHCTQHFPNPEPQTHITVHNACFYKNIVINP